MMQQKQYISQLPAHMDLNNIADYSVVLVPLLSLQDLEDNIIRTYCDFIPFCVMMQS